jgi:hypothetical protein
MSLAGQCMIAWSIYHLLSIGSCGTSTTPACSAPSLISLALLLLGFIVSVTGMFTGGGSFAFWGAFIAIGGGAVAAAVSGVAGELGPFGFVFGGMFLLFGPLIALATWAINRRFLRLLSASPEQSMAHAVTLMRSGVKAIGTVVGVDDTGMTINDDPRIKLTMRLQPIDGSEESVRSKIVIMSRVSLPRIGDRFPAWFDRDDPNAWAFATDMTSEAPESVKDLFARAQAGQAAAAG